VVAAHREDRLTTGRGPFLEALARRPVVFDGAMTTMLRAAGWPADRPVELASVEAPALVQGIHDAYRRAGTDVLTANTFGAHGLRLEALKLADRVEELCAAAVALARASAGDGAWVAVSIGPPGEPVFPLGDKSYRVAIAAYRRQLEACRAAGADLFVLETFTDLLEVQAALTAAREAGAAPVVVSMQLQPERLAAGLVSVEALAEVAAALGAGAVGLNCMPPPQTAAALEGLMARARIPVVVQPSAGPPSPEGGYPLGPEDFATWTPALARLGVAGLGGCCGTTPGHVAAVAAALRPASR
jgi:5-methyltetrahydrofolate--homocysteine methyltransferase